MSVSEVGEVVLGQVGMGQMGMGSAKGDKCCAGFARHIQDSCAI